MNTFLIGDRHGCDRIGLDLQLTMQSVFITTKIMNSNPAHGEVYSIQHDVIKFVSDLWYVGGLLRVLRFAPIKPLNYY